MINLKIGQPKSKHSNTFDVQYLNGSTIRKRTSFRCHLNTRQVLKYRFSDAIKSLNNKNVINAAIQRALDIDRLDPLKRVEKTEKKKRITFLVTYNPILPSITNIVQKHWKTLTRNENAKEIFPNPPMVAYKQPPNLKLTLCRAALAQNRRDQRSLTGYKRCISSCNVCPYSFSTREYTAKTFTSRTGEKFDMKGLYGCHSQSVIYQICCLKCKKQYIGQTGRNFHLRAMEHLRSIKAKEKTIGLHFTKCKSENFKIQVIEKVFPDNELFRLEREKHWITALKTKEPHGLNIM